MKYVIAIVRPDKLEAVQNALDAKEVHLMTVSNVYGCGSQRGYTETFRGGSIPIRLLPKVKLEIAVNENFVEAAVGAIKTAAFSGKIGDGKIFVLPLDQCYRIRTGETGNVAIGP
jgi:nitrogen regulatory protein P-II 1